MKYGAAIYLGGIRNPYNEGYSVFFNFTDVSEIENAPDSSVIHQVSGYLLSVISNRICLYTWPYLQSFNDETVKRLYELSAAKYNERQSTTGNTIRRRNACRQSVPLENGFYKVAVICGYI